MNFVDTIKKWRSALNKEVRIFNAAEQARTNDLPYLYNWFWTASLGMPRKVDINELRQYAKSCWVQMVTNAISKQLMVIEWDVIADDENKNGKYDEDIKKVKKLLKYPNRNNMTFWEIWGPWIRDVLEIDAGVIYKGRNAKGELVELFPYDGSRFLFDLEEHGILNGYWQYSYKYPKNKPLHYDTDEIIYGRMNLSNEYYPYGFSPLQSIQQEVELLIQSTRWNKEFYKNNAMPDGIITIPMAREQMEKFKAAWEQEIKGKPHKLLFNNVEGADVKSFTGTSKEMEWLDGQRWFFHLVFAAYGLSPQEVGFYEQSNRATSESQERVTIRNAIKPYLQLIADKINREIIPDVIGNDSIKFEWYYNDDVAEKIEHEQTMQKLQANVLTINEVRAMDGLDPVEWGDKPYGMMMQEKTAELMGGSFAGQDNNQNENRFSNRDKTRQQQNEEQQPEEKQNEEIIAKEVDAGKDIIDESTPYDRFLYNEFNSWKSDILNAVEEKMKDEIIAKEYVQKTFPEFLRIVFNKINTSGFAGRLVKIIRKNLISGIEEVEDEFKIDIGFGPNFEQDINTQVKRQMDGFVIDGEHWNGLKGVTDDLRKAILNIVAEGVADRKHLDEIKKDIQAEFKKYTGDELTDGRVTKIARTESNRMHNFGKLKAFKESGLQGFKIWQAKLDERTSKICRELHGQKVRINDNFKSTEGEYFQPPAHCFCRSTIKFELEE
ncbi:MAG: phage portal protein [Bacillota bacterium]